jgi:hypothetical protein
MPTTSRTVPALRLVSPFDEAQASWAGSRRDSLAATTRRLLESDECSTLSTPEQPPRARVQPRRGEARRMDALTVWCVTAQCRRYVEGALIDASTSSADIG